MGGAPHIGNSTFTIQNSKLLQAQNVLHVVETRGLTVRPGCRSQSAAREGLAARSFMREFHALSLCGVNYRVIAHDVAAANRMHADLVLGAFADDTVPPMPG